MVLQNKIINRLPNESTEHLVKRMEASLLMYDEEYVMGYGIFKVRCKKSGFEYARIKENGFWFRLSRHEFIKAIDNHNGQT
jgi:hypothetical protein